MNRSRTSTDHLVIAVLATTFIGQFYLNPFSSGFRFSFSVIALSLFLLEMEDLPVQRTTVLVGGSMTIFRALVLVMTDSSVLFLDALMGYFPAWMYYLLFGAVFELTSLRQKKDQPLTLWLGLWVVDVVPNITEVLARGEWQKTPFEQVVLTILVTGLMRSTMTVSARWIFHRAMDSLAQKERLRHQQERLFDDAPLQAELYTLTKSVHDIENAMALSYDLYETLHESDHKDKALTIAKDIHEIKKDYARVIAGFASTLHRGPADPMSLSQLMDILEKQSQRMIKEKAITFTYKLKTNLNTHEHFALVTILGNLLHNAFDAIEGAGKIHLEIREEDRQLFLEVTDDGCGIDPADEDLLFTPGFSTKYNPISGKMSTGIGLVHVKNLVEDHLMGSISFSSEKGVGTTFRVCLPLDRLIYE